ncbi:hypothetical protein E2562_006358 [Oryza meyeriana var. granulata]|uniref:Uncharacterized protein n=1 Tax=Oryza meyeriana var. granulata TaxID=110450 RepID=A0A6G1EFD9_9ORYZ|nr:hypothetical protein E2562_006358 [Oryza meyeriana var. granulata]
MPRISWWIDDVEDQPKEKGEMGGSVHISNGYNMLTCSQADATCISDELYGNGKHDRAKSPSVGGNPMPQDLV